MLEKRVNVLHFNFAANTGKFHFVIFSQKKKHCSREISNPIQSHDLQLKTENKFLALSCILQNLD